MTVEELIAALQALPPEDRALPVRFHNEFHYQPVERVEIFYVHPITSHFGTLRYRCEPDHEGAERTIDLVGGYDPDDPAQPGGALSDEALDVNSSWVTMPAAAVAEWSPTYHYISGDVVVDRAGAMGPKGTFYRMDDDRVFRPWKP